MRDGHPEAIDAEVRGRRYEEDRTRGGEIVQHNEHEDKTHQRHKPEVEERFAILECDDHNHLPTCIDERVWVEGAPPRREAGAGRMVRCKRLNSRARLHPEERLRHLRLGVGARDLGGHADRLLA
eukprot:2412199-Prymnesium_polylepis.1